MPEPSQLIRLLARRGPSSGPELADALSISQPTFFRLVRACGLDVLRVGRARATRYAARRTLADVQTPVPVVEIGGPGHPPRRLLALHPILPDGFWVEALVDDEESHFVDDLPWFLGDLRPSGFLGRLVPRRLPEFPADVLRWTADDVLRWATRFAWDGPGALVVGDEALQRFLREQATPSDAVQAGVRSTRYCELAADVLGWGTPGSSAGGERPKFLATRVDGAEHTPVLVKFSPPTDDAVAVRVADLLVAEHLALEVVAAHGHPAARSQVLIAGGRTFLEVDRFDRHGTAHRTGQLSLQWADAEHVGSRGARWLSAIEALVAQGRLPEDAVRATRWLEAFGRWIGNTDMHGGNLSLTLAGTRITGLAPAYDVSPMAWIPRAGELADVRWTPPPPDPADAEVAHDAFAAACALWEQVAADERVSADFRRIATEQRGALDVLRPQLALLPRQPAG